MRVYHLIFLVFFLDMFITEMTPVTSSSSDSSQSSYLDDMTNAGKNTERRVGWAKGGVFIDSDFEDHARRCLAHNVNSSTACGAQPLEWDGLGV